jgi:hypothetical protein
MRRTILAIDHVRILLPTGTNIGPLHAILRASKRVQITGRLKPEYEVEELSELEFREVPESAIKGIDSKPARAKKLAATPVASVPSC